MSYDFSRRPGVPRNLGSSERPRASRCFRTTADGRIAVTSDWMKLMARFVGMGPVAFQTRRAYARIVAVMPVPDVSWCPHRGRACDGSGALQFNFACWRRAWARLAHCECCGSPGRVEVCNEHGLDFLQICAMPEFAAEDWADLLGDVVATTSNAEAETAFGETASLPQLPVGARIVSESTDDLPRLLGLFPSLEMPMVCSLVTAEVCHQREFTLRHVGVTDGVLTAGAGLSRFQLGLSAARRIAVTMDEGGPRLHVAGVDDVLLLTLAGVRTGPASFFWKEALHAVFPGL